MTLRPLKIRLVSFYHWIRCLFNRVFRLGDMLARRPQLHVGCGDVHFDDCVNIDLRPTRATDIVGDCVTLSGIPDHSVRAVYANAFLEHIFLNNRLACLRSVRRVLTPDGVLAITAIPDFEQIARAYLRGKPGLVGPKFDLDTVYRYTHGNPEGAGDWMAQLHKSLFDLTTLISLVNDAGFASYCIATYSFRKDPISVSFLLLASPSKRSLSGKGLLGLLADDVNGKSIKIVATSYR